MGLAVKLRMIAAMLLCLTAVTAQNLKTFTATYGPFNNTYFDIFDPVNSANISNGVLQLTPNSAYLEGSSGMPLENQVGRTLLKRPFTLSEPNYNKTLDRVASFNSSFLFSVCPLGRNTTPGEGLAFIIAQPFKYWLPSNSSGQYLGLINPNTDGDPANSLVAIEFDNVKQEFDPDANHVGLNINSIVSNVTSPLTPLGIELAPDGEAVLVVEFSLLVIGVAVTVYYYLYKKRSMAQFKSNILLGALKRLPGTPREFQFKDLKKATNNFDEKNKLGRGGFGVVYRGYLQDENLEVAVKWFSRETMKGEDDFLAELTIINRLRHKHLVRLLGWCYKNGKLLLVYDYMPNGCLDAHLFTKTPDSKPLSWDQRHNIISGVASALNYLHNEYHQRVVHRDIKASNIMLDSDFNARLGDFGLARALDKEKTSYSEVEGVAGTIGYIAPECFLTCKATEQSDVYAFGVVLLEIVCGLRTGTKIGEFRFLVDWVWSLHREGHILDAVEERLGDEYIVEEAQKVLVLALACCHLTASERPRTQAIVHIISGLVPVPYVPPFKPVFVWPSMPALEEDDTSSLGSTTETESFPTTHLGSGLTTQSISRELYAGDKFKSV